MKKTSATCQMPQVKGHSRGVILTQVLVFASISVVMLTGLVGWAGANVKSARHAFYREQAFQIAEAGIEYYRWHLAHDQDDFQDGTGVAGPYVHNYLDKDGNVLGTYTLDIVPPPIGSTIVTVRSKGVVNAYPTVYRRIEARMAIPSWAKYAVVTDSLIQFGTGTEIFGPVHSNGGISLFGLTHNIMTSARNDYDDPNHSGANEFGVHTHVNPPPVNPVPPNAPSTSSFRPLEAPPNPLPLRPDVFEAGRQISVPAVDFTGLTTDMNTIKVEARDNGGFYRAGSGANGYRILLKTNDTFDLYRVNTLRSAPPGCSRPATPAPPAPDTQLGWGTWSIATSGGAQTLLGNYPIPGNGLIFLEDRRVWVEGQINSARVTIAASVFSAAPATQSHITVNNDLLYTNYDGQDAVSLIAEYNINAGLYSEDDLRIDAAVVAQQGRVGRYYYGNCGSYSIRNRITLFGMIATFKRYAFLIGGTYGNTGYTTRNIDYDVNLLYAPPPSFPLTSDQYTILSWQEIK